MFTKVCEHQLNSERNLNAPGSEQVFGFSTENHVGVCTVCAFKLVVKQNEVVLNVNN